MAIEIKKAWNAVNESLAKIWKPIVDTIGIPYVSCADYDLEKILYGQCKHFDENLWSGLTAILEKSIASIAVVSQDEECIEITLPDIDENLFHICFTLETCYDTYAQTVDPDEVNGKFITEAIEYLIHKETIPAFQFVTIFIQAGNIRETRLIGRDYAVKDLYEWTGAIVDGFLKPPIVYGLLSLVKKAQDERSETYRIAKERALAREEEKARLECEFASQVKPHIEKAGWSGKWSVYKEFSNFVLELELSKTDIIRYSSSSRDEIISHIPTLVNFANDYKVLNDSNGYVSVLKDYNIFT